jgi:hypothetical protein
MCPSLRDLLEAPERARALPPEAMAAILGELVLLLARLLVMINTSVPGTQQDPKQDVQERLFTVQQVADLLGVRRAHIYALARRRELPVIHVASLCGFAPMIFIYGFNTTAKKGWTKTFDQA